VAAGPASFRAGGNPAIRPARATWRACRFSGFGYQSEAILDKSGRSEPILPTDRPITDVPSPHGGLLFQAHGNDESTGKGCRRRRCFSVPLLLRRQLGFRNKIIGPTTFMTPTHA